MTNIARIYSQVFDIEKASFYHYYFFCIGMVFDHDWLATPFVMLTCQVLLLSQAHDPTCENYNYNYFRPPYFAPNYYPYSTHLSYQNNFFNPYRYFNNNFFRYYPTNISYYR